MTTINDIIGKEYKSLDGEVTIKILNKTGVRNPSDSFFAHETDEYPQQIVVYTTEKSSHQLYLSDETIISNVENGVWSLNF